MLTTFYYSNFQIYILIKLKEIGNDSYKKSRWGYHLLNEKIFSKFIEEWFINYYQKRVAQSTFITNKIIIEKHILFENPFGYKEISEISASDINSFYCSKLKNKYSAVYIRKMHNLLNQVFSQALKWGIITSNPMLEVMPPAIVKKKISVWSANEVQKFLEKCKTEDHYLTFLLAIITGMKKRELLALKWSDISFENQIIHIKSSLSSNQNRGYVTNKIERVIPISEFLINELKKHKKVQDDWKKIVGQLYDDQELVICTITGKHENPLNISLEMKRIIEIAEVRKMGFHNLRYAFTSLLILSGADIKHISYLLGGQFLSSNVKYYSGFISPAD